MCECVKCLIFPGKNFLNSIEYLDEKTNEWTTFVPKLVMQDNTEAFHTELVQGNGVFLGSLHLQREDVNGSADVHQDSSDSDKNTNTVEGPVPRRRKRSQKQ
jgi:hypothetical protein